MGNSIHLYLINAGILDSNWSVAALSGQFFFFLFFWLLQPFSSHIIKQFQINILCLLFINLVNSSAISRIMGHQMVIIAK